MRTWLKVTFRRYWPAAQDGMCHNGHLILHERRRRPCSECGEMRRMFWRDAYDGIGAFDRPS